MSDSITGVDLTRSASSACLGDCRDDYNTAVMEEKKRHAAQNEACRSLTQPDRNACLDAENQLYQQNLATLKAELIDCQNNCHRQGTGTGS